ncbi:MAG: CpXC domain-containing protein [Clostridia bacterium]|nr:CpXC domain-containing protein [Clostridia bacterium]
MSVNYKETVKCPKCQKESDITIWEFITVKDSPDLKEDLLKGKLNIFECDECGERALFPAPILYHDEDKKLVLSFFSTNSPEETEEAYKMMLSTSKELEGIEDLENYNLRFVTEYNSLMEKILIFDAGLNDKTIEVIKLMVLQNAEGDSDSLKPFFGKKYEDGSIEILVNDLKTGKVYTSKAPKETYQTIHTALKSSGVKEKSFNWEMVDRNYAEKLLGC